MKRSALAGALLIALAVAAAAPATSHAPDHLTMTWHFAIVASGGTVVDGGGTRLLLDLEDAPKSPYLIGSGAASLFVFPQADGSQKATGHAYYKYQVFRLRLTYTVAPPDADNVSAINGTGRLRGTGTTLLDSRKARGTFAITGSQDASGLLKLRLAGKIHFPTHLPLSGRGH